MGERKTQRRDGSNSNTGILQTPVEVRDPLNARAHRCLQAGGTYRYGREGSGQYGLLPGRLLIRCSHDEAVLLLSRWDAIVVFLGLLPSKI